MSLLAGRVAIVTGAGNGIGKAHALYLAAQGAKVVVNDIGGARDGSGTDTRAADEVVEEIRARGGDATASYDSVASVDGVEAMFFAALGTYGKLDILVNNAGILRDRTLVKMSAADFDQVIEVHLRGTFLASRNAARIMKVQGAGGRIINTTSISGLIGNFGQGSYAAAKAGIYGLTRVSALELAKQGITVNAIAPVALTRMTKDLARYQTATEEELGPQHISPLVGFLASDLAKDITGKIFGVHGRKIFEYRMEMTEGVTKSEGVWTPEEILEAMGTIGR